jgi:chemotaxis-related protein WspD
MRSNMDQQHEEQAEFDACWRRIGVQGDRSCPKLAQAVHCRNCPVFSAAGQALFDRALPPEYLDQCTRQLAEVEETVSGEAISLLVFRVGPEWLAIEAGLIVEVVEQRPIHRIPHRTNQLLLGLANIRGELHLCVSLRELLGIHLPEHEPESDSATSVRRQPRLLVTERGADRWVFPVDEVEGVRRVPAGAMENLPHTVQRSARYYSKAIFSDDRKRVGMLSVDRLFQALESTVR